MDVVVGIDVATAAARATCVAADGRVVATGSARLPSPEREEPGHSEQDATTWWPAVVAGLRAATGDLPRGTGVAGVCVSATSGTIAAVDRHGSPVGPALMYDDRRAASLNERAQRLGAQRWATLGMSVAPTAALGRIAWLHRENGARIVHTPDLVGERLAGHPVAADWSHALKSGYDALAGEWPAEVFAGLDVPLSVLPEVVAPGSVIGTVGATETGLPVGTPIVAGMTDGCAGQLACGAVRPGQFVGVLGTTYVLKGVSEALVPDPTGALYSHRHPDGWWLPGGASNTGGEVLHGERDLAALDAAAARRGPASVLCYPLRRDGERFPFVAGEARGFLVGTPVDEADRHRAALEGVAFCERLGLDHVRRLGIPVLAPLAAAGGGNRSALWNRIRATVTGLPLRVAEHAETGFGAALLAASATLHDGVSAATEAMVAEGTTVAPDPAEADALDASYRAWCAELHTRGWIDDELLKTALS